MQDFKHDAAIGTLMATLLLTSCAQHGETETDKSVAGNGMPAARKTFDIEVL